jgi:ketosteroid isomerase-like protein
MIGRRAEKGEEMSAQAERALEHETRRLLEFLDEMDLESLAAMLTDDAQGVDEISRGWRRGRAALNDYLSELEGTVADVESQITDLHVTDWGDVGAVTFVLDQTYEIDGKRQSLSAPTSLVFRRQDDDWKVALIHSVPLPEQGP